MSKWMTPLSFVAGILVIRHPPDLTAQERDSLRAATGDDAHHHREAANGSSAKTAQPAQPVRGSP